MSPALILSRFYSGKCTLGVITDEQNEIICYTLENPWEDNARNVSCIPDGDYEVVPYSSAKYPHSFEIIDVPGRDAILIHHGNTIKDTLGCILVGESLGKLGMENAVLKSRDKLDSMVLKYFNGFNLKIITVI